MNTNIRPFALSLALAALCGCAATPEGSSPDPELDPFEGINRRIFAFNERLDRHLLAPVAKGYRLALPGIVERGVSNFFANLYDFNGGFNALLQGRMAGAVRDGGRFVLNSTLGMAGVVDVASAMGIAPYHTDFGHTLAIWGVSQGPYLMVPLLGPRTMRSGTGAVVDWVAMPQWYVEEFTTRVTLFSLEVIEHRAALSDAEQLLSGDRYIFLRDAYLQQRAALVNDGAVEDTFSDFEDDFDWE